MRARYQQVVTHLTAVAWGSALTRRCLTDHLAAQVTLTPAAQQALHQQIRRAGWRQRRANWALSLLIPRTRLRTWRNRQIVGLRKVVYEAGISRIVKGGRLAFERTLPDPEREALEWAVWRLAVRSRLARLALWLLRAHRR